MALLLSRFQPNHLWDALDPRLRARKKQPQNLRQFAQELQAEKEHQTQVYSDTDLLHASKEGDLSRVNSVLSDPRANINAMDKDKMTPVMFAASSGHREVFDLLVRKGANLSLSDVTGDNILHLACNGENVDIVKYVLTQNIVDINSRDADEWTPVMATAYNGDKGVFDVLVEAGADLSLLNNNEEDIFYLACEGGNVEIIKYLLTQGNVDINRKQYGSTTVMEAALANNKVVFDFLVKEGADLSLLSDDNGNILHSACVGGNVEIVKYLLTQNIVDINSQDGEDRTPAMIAAHKGHKAVFDLLVQKGANLTIVNDAGDNILNIACKGRNVDIVNKYLLTFLHITGSSVITPLEYENDRVFPVPLHECVGGNVEIVKYLLTQNIVDINRRDGENRTPAMTAAHKGSKAVFDLLVNNGADLRIVSYAGDNILNMACKGGDVDIVKYVITRHIVKGRLSEDNPCGMHSRSYSKKCLTCDS
ncbi:putative ankyrin repeat protein RF_0381 [Haliotis cracherodii]|uniref:putative ankyrin repeat protein RF_0381 n=1 Tax=Haliotis cracherodii TaxID=6455 RepID=UPI0039E81024